MVKRTGIKSNGKYRGNTELEKLNERLEIDRDKLEKNDPTGNPLPVRPTEEGRYRADIGETDDTYNPLSSTGVEEDRNNEEHPEHRKHRRKHPRRAVAKMDFEKPEGAEGENTGTQGKGFTGEMIPLVRPQEPEAIGEAYGEAVAGALGDLQLTDGARRLLEMGLSGGIEIDTNAIFTELRELVASPVQGLLEAQRVGTLNKLYGAAEKTVDSLIEHLNDSNVFTPATRVMFLKTLLSEIRKLQELGGAVTGGVRLPAGVHNGGGTMKLTRETVTIDLNKRTGRLKADKVLGHDGSRPSDDFLKAGR